jgi:hypothetical protein
MVIRMSSVYRHSIVHLVPEGRCRRDAWMCSAAIPASSWLKYWLKQNACSAWGKHVYENTPQEHTTGTHVSVLSVGFIADSRHWHRAAGFTVPPSLRRICPPFASPSLACALRIRCNLCASLSGKVHDWSLRIASSTASTILRRTVYFT